MKKRGANSAAACWSSKLGLFAPWIAAKSPIGRPNHCIYWTWVDKVYVDLPLGLLDPVDYKASVFKGNIGQEAMA